MNYILLPGVSSLQALNCGIAILNPGWIHPSRTLSSSVLILGKKGAADIREENEVLRVMPDTFVLLTAGRHHEGNAPIETTASYLWMHFETRENPEILDEQYALSVLEDENLRRSVLADSLLLPQSLSLKDAKLFHELFHDLLYVQERPSFTAQKMQLLFRLMLIHLNESVLNDSVDDAYESTRYNLIYAVIQIIHENFTDGNFSVKKVSDLVQYNTDYLGRVFKLRMGKSLGDYITDQRIKYAVALLIESNSTVETIAYDSGFNSTRNFIRQFKARKGETPSELRQRHRTMHITNR